MAADSLSHRVPSPTKVRVRENGRFTIPLEFRNRIGIGNDTVVEVSQVGKAIIITPACLSSRKSTLAVNARKAMKTT